MILGSQYGRHGGEEGVDVEQTFAFRMKGNDNLNALNPSLAMIGGSYPLENSNWRRLWRTEEFSDHRQHVIRIHGLF